MKRRPQSRSRCTTAPNPFRHRNRRILNGFFEIVVERCGGLLDKFEGNAALAVFGTPAPLDDAAGTALSCARAI
ncbi:hypothetical protein [Nocardia sp. NPDC049526]|uniref:hypothetical protein n=1 Tax=Nocardia sp. NPDC049526 TaxID=3364316 RepID=UPI0037A51DD3